MTSQKPIASSVLGAITVALVGYASVGLAGADAKADQMPIFQFDPTWPKIPLPHDWALGTVTGVDVDDQQHVWIVHRPHTLLHNYEDGLEHQPPTALCCRMAPPVIEFDQTGNVLRSWGGPGEGYQWPQPAADMHAPSGALADAWFGEHTVHVDYKGNVWIGNNAAVGSDGHILKFTSDGNYLLTVGRVGKGKRSNDTTTLGKPTGVIVWPATNEVFVTDGYTNHRVIVFDADTGAYKRHWGAYGNKPNDAAQDRCVPGEARPAQFHTPHGLRISHDGLVYVADRGHCRVQVFKIDGTYVNEVFVAPDTPQGSAFDVSFSAEKDQRFLYVLDGRSDKVWILRRADLKVLGNFGCGGHFAGCFTTPHNMATDGKGNIYVTESAEGKRVQRFLYKGLGPAQLK
jgi:DNA-binding beta-propeller fold protein YncE